MVFTQTLYKMVTYGASHPQKNVFFFKSQLRLKLQSITLNAFQFLLHNCHMKMVISPLL